MSEKFRAIDDGWVEISRADRDRWAHDLLNDPRLSGEFRVCHSGDSIVLVWPNEDGTADVYDCLIRSRIANAPIVDAHSVEAA
jgi:hypothetical protein